jgi:hypothetical protein
MAKRSVQVAGPAQKQKKVILPQGDPVAIAERFKDFPNIDVLSRRFNDPNEPGSLPILLKDEPAHACVNSEHMNRLKPGAVTCHLCKQPARKWYVRWFNLGMEGRNAQMRSKGYIGVEVKELRDSGDVADLYSDRSDKDTLVRRGDRGQELLAKIPLEAYNYIKGRQRDAWNARAMSGKRLKQDLAEAAGAELGDEAGQTISDGGIKIEKMTRSKTTLGDEALVDA